jgi:hypothetical protein
MHFRTKPPPRRGPPIRTLLVLAILLVVGLTIREPLERALLTRSLASASGYAVEIGQVRHEGRTLVLEDVGLSSPSGVFLAQLPRAELAYGDDGVAVTLDAPQLTFSVQRWRGGAGTRLGRALRALHVDRMHLTINGGSVNLSAGSVPQVAASLQNLTVSADVASDTFDYTAGAMLFADGASYPLEGHASAASGVWQAHALPLAVLGELANDAPAKVTGGTLREATWRFAAGAPPRFEAHVEDADLVLEDGKKLAGVHGPISFEIGLLGSRGLAGVYDGIPFQFEGEARDLGPSFAWLWNGTPQLRGIAELVKTVGDEPRVQSMRVETIAPSLEYAEYAMTGDHGPLAVSVLFADPREPSLHFDTAIAEDRVISGGERTSAMGVRTHAVGGANGDYFDIGRSYQPQGLLIRHGELLRGPTDRAALVVDRNGRVTFGEFRLRGTLTTPRANFPVTQLNDWPAGDVTVITPRFGKLLPADDDITFAQLTPLARAGTYRVGRVLKVTQPLPVTFGVAFGKLLKGPLPRSGDVVSLHYGLDPPVRGAVAAIGGGPILIRNGAWYDDPHAPAPDERDVRWPVIALARRADDSLLLVAVDGRHPERSVGMTRPEFGELLLRYGAVDAMALDSGGSVTLVARAPGDKNVTVRNHPSDGSAERWVSDALYVYSSAPPPTLISPVVASTPVPEARPAP